MHTPKDDRLHKVIAQKRKLDYLNAATLMQLAKCNNIQSVITANLRYCGIQNSAGNT